MPGSGRIIFLNGASSSGKTTLARALQRLLDEPFLHYSFDHFRNSQIIPMEDLRRGRFHWNSMREVFFDGFHRSLPAFAGAGNDLIVEHIIESPDWLASLVHLLHGYDVFLVAVHCPLLELERRERLRGDRPVGDARRDLETIHKGVEYDLEVDGRRDPGISARELVEAWHRRGPGSAVERMGQRRA